jgi:long-subunit fatty acid transport protein
MIKFFKNIFLLTLFGGCLSATGQTTTSSPYSQFGLGDLKSLSLPQTRAMGGISMGIRKPGPYDNINIANPASYSALELTVFDIGASMDIRQLSKNGTAGKNQFNSTLSHINFAMPVNKFSVLSFGLMPYSDLGYQFKNAGTVDTNKVEYIYGGEGGVSKAYLGYGFKINKKLSLGFNMAYLFGSLKENRSFEFLYDLTGYGSRTQYQKSISGLSFDYGLQYSTNTGKKSKLTLGYAGNSGNDLNSTNKIVTTRYLKNIEGDEPGVVDSSFFFEGAKSKIKMPMTHTLGFAFEKTNKWVLGADVSYGRWSDFREGNTNPNLNNSFGVAVGGQITPDPTTINNYFKLVDYRFGLKYDKTFISVNSTDIKQYALTFGLGLPLPRNRSSFYKINLSAEVGQRGTQKNNLVRDRFVNINLGFTLNDKWFQKVYVE